MSKEFDEYWETIGSKHPMTKDSIELAFESGMEFAMLEARKIIKETFRELNK
ncbi:MAG: hypothetical protein ACUZ8H_02215 [Candidatus Anammoxibacter sp.]